MLVSAGPLLSAGFTTPPERRPPMVASTRLATALIGGAYLHGNGDENKNKEQEGSVLSHSDKQLASADENEEPQMTLC